MNRLSSEKSSPQAGIIQENGVTQKVHSTVKTTRQIINRHLQDKNDMITEEDFKNLNIEPNLSINPAYQPLQIPEDTEQPKD